MTKNIYLIGARASGKTSLGRALARALGRDFVDTDALIQERAGMSVARIVAAEGWEGFRDRETEVLEAVAAKTGLVAACGGGLVLRERNRGLLAAGLVLYLDAGPEVLASRLSLDPNESQRPSLTGRPIEDEIRAVLKEREPLYLSCARAVLDACLPLEAVLKSALAAVGDPENF
ncbi:MAG: shikimate kinase AroL [Desulfovibrionaceae bacterium]|nr:shikimate kinase AroL [Desulfovibrionaceae bacterium]MDD4951738.1 shikimate kinase AroL [Desulfovibrionaceae bacterium]